MKSGNYEAIINFYYYKICDSIMNLDVNNSLIKDDTFEKKY